MGNNLRVVSITSQPATPQATYLDRLVPLVVGLSSGGVFNQRKRFVLLDDITAELVSGDGALMAFEYLYREIQAGAPVQAVDFLRVSPWRVDAEDTNSLAVTSESGTATDNNSVPLQNDPVYIEFTGAGAPGTATYSYRLNSAEDWVAEDVTTSSDGYLTLSRYGLKLLLGGTFAVGDSILVTPILNSTASAVVKEAAGETTGTLTIENSQPMGAFNLRVEVTSDGVRGVANFRYSLDGTTDNYSEEYTIPADGSFIIPNTGLELEFSDGIGEDGFTEGDLFTATTTAPTYTIAALEAALNAYFDQRVENNLIHVMGAADIETVAFIRGYAARAQAQNNHTIFLLEGPLMLDTETIAEFEQRVLAEFNTDFDKYVMLAVGDATSFYHMTNCNFTRSAACQVGPALAVCAISQDPGSLSGSLPDMVSMNYDGLVRRGLEDKGFTYLCRQDNAPDEFKVAEARQYYKAEPIFSQTYVMRIVNFVASSFHAVSRGLLKRSIPLANGKVQENTRLEIEGQYRNVLTNLISNNIVVTGTVTVPANTWDVKRKHLTVECRIQVPDVLDELVIPINVSY